MRSLSLRTPLDPERPRRGWRRTLAAVAVTALAVGGLLFGVAAPASAHNPSLDVTCTTLTLSLNSYNPGTPNTVTIVIGGKTLVDKQVFSTGYDYSYTFADPSVGTSYDVQVVAGDDPPGSDGNGPNNWSKHYVGVSPTCAAPGIGVTATPCTSIGGTTSLSAALDNLYSSDVYTVTVTANGRPVGSPVTISKPAASKQVVQLGSQSPGVAYTVTVKDDTTGLSNFDTATGATCPQLGDFSIQLQQCSAPGGSATVSIVDADLAPGHTYTVHSGSVSGPVVGTFEYAAGGTYPIALTAPATGTETVTIFVVDVQGSTFAGSAATTLEACPTQPTALTATPASCTTGATASDVTATFGGLSTGRTYQPTLNGAAHGAQITSSTTQPIDLGALAPGTYSVGIYDVGAPGVKATPVSVTVGHCAAVPAVQAAAIACTTLATANGAPGIAITLSDLVPTRSYVVSVVDANGAKLQPDVTLTDVTASTVPPITIATAAEKTTYTVTVTDAADPQVFKSASVTTGSCPQVAALSISCVSGILTVGVTDLTPGDTFTATFDRVNPNGTITTVKSVPPTTALTAADLTYSPVSVGQTYNVAVNDLTTPSLGQQLNGIPIDSTCVTTVPTSTTTGQVDAYSVQASQLAHTGIDTAPFVGAAAAFVVSGAGLIGFAAYRRRKEVRD